MRNDKTIKTYLSSNIIEIITNKNNKFRRMTIKKNFNFINGNLSSRLSKQTKRNILYMELY